jgi:hypothetical protein
VAVLGQSGVRSLAVVPLSFTSENVETLYELDMLVKQAAVASSVAHYIRVPTLDTSPRYIKALAELVRMKCDKAAHVVMLSATRDKGRKKDMTTPEGSPYNKKARLERICLRCRQVNWRGSLCLLLLRDGSNCARRVLAATRPDRTAA